MNKQAEKSSPLRWDGQFYTIPAALLSDSRMTSRHIHVYLALITDARQRGGDIVACPTLARLADKTGLAEATISRTTKDLDEWGWLKRRQIAANTVNEYRLSVPGSASNFLRVVEDRKMSDEDYSKVKAARDAKTAEYNEKRGLKQMSREERDEAKIEEFLKMVGEDSSGIENRADPAESDDNLPDLYTDNF